VGCNVVPVKVLAETTNLINWRSIFINLPKVTNFPGNWMKAETIHFVFHRINRHHFQLGESPMLLFGQIKGLKLPCFFFSFFSPGKSGHFFDERLLCSKMSTKEYHWIIAQTVYPQF